MLLLVLSLTAAFFAGAGLLYAFGSNRKETPDAYISARGEIGALATGATLFASAMGPWILFGPPEAGTWGGLPAVVGYGIGSALPLLLYIPLGLKMRRQMPEGYSLAEYVRHRYGRKMHGLILLVMLFYLFIALAAQVTGIAFIIQLVADVPLWITAALVLVTTLAYTLLGGLRASIFTDGLQSVLILPLLIMLAAAGVSAIGGVQASIAELAAQAPQLMDWTYGPGLEGGAALVIGICAAGLFNQGTWQRVYAADTDRSLKKGFLLALLANVPVILMMGLFGLAAVGWGMAEPPSMALFNVLLEELSTEMAMGLIVLGLALVMSSADTMMSAITSLVVADAGLYWPHTTPQRRIRASKVVLVLLCIPVFLIAVQGYSVLYLFLVADLVCAAAAYPVFAGLFDPRFDERAALWSVAAGLAAGGLLFPMPGSAESLLPAFATALTVPVAVMYLLRPSKAVNSASPLGEQMQVLEE